MVRLPAATWSNRGLREGKSGTFGFSHGDAILKGILTELLEWRNWQTHGTQKPKQRIAEG
jgi:hypothetical protein